jgi:hypothetical protein
LNTEGKVLEKLLIKRIMNHLYKTEFLNEEYGFTPQKSAVDSAIAVRQYIELYLKRGGVVIAASLDVKGAFGSAWWPAILKGLQDAKCLRNLYYLAQDYLKERKAVITIKEKVKKKKQKAVRKGHVVAQGSGTFNMTPYLTSTTPTTPKQMHLQMI